MGNYSTLAALGLMAFQLAAQTPAAQAPAGGAPAREPGLYATMKTTQGVIVMKLFERETPVTVKNFVYLAQGRKSWKDPKTGQMVRRPLYNGLTFHRVIPGFMIQGGDPLGNGMGGTAAIKDEFVPTLKFDRPGRLAMANAGPGTGSCQFFITEGTPTYLNNQHTIFGQVVEGQDVVSKIARVPRDSNDMPRTPVRILAITFVREGAAPADDVLAPAAAKKAGAGAKGGAKSGAKKAAPKKAAPAK